MYLSTVCIELPLCKSFYVVFSTLWTTFFFFLKSIQCFENVVNLVAAEQAKMVERESPGPVMQFAYLDPCSLPEPQYVGIHSCRSECRIGVAVWTVVDQDFPSHQIDKHLPDVEDAPKDLLSLFAIVILGS